MESGRSAIAAIDLGLRTAGRSRNSVRRILDYPCGFGRIARWLSAAFPNADLLGVDADPKAVASIRDFLGIRAQHADLTLSQELGEEFDLIWMGSLITHLPETETLKVLSYLRRHLVKSGPLAKGGVFVGTMHGELVVSRIRSRERLYGLQEPEAESFLTTYDVTGYGFGAYSHSSNYGISAWTDDKGIELLRRSQLKLLGYYPKLWHNHQDVFAASAN